MSLYIEKKTKNRNTQRICNTKQILVSNFRSKGTKQQIYSFNMLIEEIHCNKSIIPEYCQSASLFILINSDWINLYCAYT